MPLAFFVTCQLKKLTLDLFLPMVQALLRCSHQPPCFANLFARSLRCFFGVTLLSLLLLRLLSRWWNSRHCQGQPPQLACTLGSFVICSLVLLRFHDGASGGADASIASGASGEMSSASGGADASIA